MNYDYDNYEDQPTDELVYGRCSMCHQLDELSPENLCHVCEGIEVREREMQKNK